MKITTALAGKLAFSVLGCAFLFGAIAPKASAFSLVPQQEGEINVGFANPLQSGSSYIGTPGFTITSLTDSSTGTPSRLFVDRAGTANTYGAVKFKSNDVGTAEKTNQYWFRPVAMKADGVTTRVENGQLEVGTFRIDFAKTMASLLVRWFDTERANATSYTAYNAAGALVSSGIVQAGANNNIRTATFANVKSLVLNLGEAYTTGTGDGVNFQMEGEAVPEPMTMGGLALGGAWLVRARRRRAKQTA